ncbi:NYN domain-containing protein [Pedococcus bigeumensis]|uniref:NYN domain-containing protein n=1 Tax=Pedococcus bigeumensis TaxID=433644 RepID=A0A502CJW8_9MICO|nr:NYN domain-containing protein [Pedococcus bigeumensis]TPG13955.1 NYN domain-containing protein [Pedococcus bigeumensis]
MDPRARIALLIDADNSSAKKIDLILNELSAYGETSIRRAYGNWTKAGLKPWADVLHARAIRPVQQFDYSRGKNASDMAMVVDAMALLYNDDPDAFGIVSSDADFTPLVMHLREKGAAVYGFGERKTPEPFRSACTRFLFLDHLAEPDEVRLDDTMAPAAASSGAQTTDLQAGEAPAAESGSNASRQAGTKKTAAKKAAGAAKKSEAAAPKTDGPPARKTTTELRQDGGLVRLLRNAVSRAADDDGWASVGAVGNSISNQSSFDSRNHGYASLSKLLKATELFEVRTIGNAMSVRDKRQDRKA